MGHGGKPWVSDFNHPHFIAGRKAMKTGTFTLYCQVTCSSLFIKEYLLFYLD